MQEVRPYGIVQQGFKSDVEEELLAINGAEPRRDSYSILVGYTTSTGLIDQAKPSQQRSDGNISLRSNIYLNDNNSIRLKPGLLS
jgi:hypothetical protein